MHIDDLSGISLGEDNKRAKQDYANAVNVIENVIGMKAQLEHGKESPSTETTVDLLGATFNIRSRTWTQVTDLRRRRLQNCASSETRSSGTWSAARVPRTRATTRYSCRSPKVALIFTTSS